MTNLPAKKTVRIDAKILGFDGKPRTMIDAKDQVQYADSFEIECGEHSFTETKIDEAVAVAAAMMARYNAVLAEDTQVKLADMVNAFCGDAPDLDNDAAPAPMAM